MSSQNVLDSPSGLWRVICPLGTSLLVWPSVFSTVPSMCGTAPNHYTPQSREWYTELWLDATVNVKLWSYVNLMSFIFKGHVPWAAGPRPTAGRAQLCPVFSGDWSGFTGSLRWLSSETGHSEWRWYRCIFTNQLKRVLSYLMFIVVTTSAAVLLLYCGVWPMQTRRTAASVRRRAAVIYQWTQGKQLNGRIYTDLSSMK